MSLKKIPKIDRVMTDTSEKSDFSSAITPTLLYYLKYNEIKIWRTIETEATTSDGKKSIRFHHKKGEAFL